MSTRTDWGWFDKDGKPIAVGDAHAKWVCPQQQWCYDGTYEHCFTGEILPVDPYPLNCPLKYQDRPRADICIRCGNQFRYP